MGILIHILIALLVWGNLTKFGNAVIVNTKYGFVEGRTLTLHTGESVNTFYNIPFAKPPLDALRWMPPEEPDPWGGIYQAEGLGAVCEQNRVGTLMITHPGWTNFDEDCLNLNIFTPEDQSGAPYPVMVWFHGGAYQSSANIQYPGHFIAAKDVVIVVSNYRLNVFGFASAPDGAAPGNYGMLDQIQTLRFVQDNIANFGGDPDKVTIFGQSAGAGSCGLHLVSPLSAGLFHQAILESGNEMAVWATNPPDQMPETYIVQIAEQLECPTDPSQDMMDCLRTKSARQVRKADFNCTAGFFCLGFAPVVDGAGGFLPDRPSRLRQRAEFHKVPEMIGITREEISIYLLAISREILNRGPNRTEYENLLDFLVSYAATNFPDPSSEPDVYAALDFYYNPWPHIEDPELLRQALVEIGTDAAFGFTWDAQMKFHSEYAPVYSYVWPYRPKNVTKVPLWMGAPHMTDLPYVFGYPFLRYNPDVVNQTEMVDILTWNDEDNEYSDFIITLWTNFAKYGNPTPVPVQPPKGMDPITWPQFTFDDLDYLFIGDEYIESRQSYRQREYAFWREYLPYIVFGYDSPWDKDPPIDPGDASKIGALFGVGDPGDAFRFLVADQMDDYAFDYDWGDY